MSKRPFRNKINDLDPKSWLKFQKSWFIHNPPARRKDVLRHPAKYPETLVQEFIEFFTKPGGVVFDPMAGTGSTNVAALRSGRNCFSIELNPSYAEIARQIISEERLNIFIHSKHLVSEVITGDASKVAEYVEQYQIPPIDYMITSPPYWDMLHAKGAETQSERKENQDLDLIYSDDPNDLGNIDDYDQFLERLILIYKNILPYLKEKAYLTIIVKNIKKGGKIYPLAWDIGKQLGEIYSLKDEKIWCQDNIRLFPYGMGNAWVSNTLHHYCLQFRNDRR
jgi:DNA modification methylase